MEARWSSTLSASSDSFLITLTLLFGIGISTGCVSTAPTSPQLGGNTSVTVLLSSTANDQVTMFDVGFQTLTLTSPSGKSVTLLSSQQPAEFVHLNAGIEPLTTVNVPPGRLQFSQGYDLAGSIRLSFPGTRGRTGNRELFNCQSRPRGEPALANYGHGQQHGITSGYASL
jgi:hypothetical protein